MMRPRHIVHLLYRFAAGGLENVLVQLVNGLPHDSFRHTIIALTEADADFAERITRQDVEIICLHKSPGQPFGLYPRMFALLRRLRPDVVHTCNIAALEFQPVAALAGVPCRIHAEHGWDVSDPDGSNRNYQRLRRFYRHFVHQFIAVSPQLYDYLLNKISVSPQRLHLIANGVDTQVFYPRAVDTKLPVGFPFSREQHFVIGTVGRLETIKNHMLLIEAFIALHQQHRERASHARLAIVGAGPLGPSIQARITEAGLDAYVWLPGTRNDIPDVLRAFDCFVLPSLAEGTACTLQEAMATGLPIIATAVGGSPDVLEHGRLGCLVPSGDGHALQAALLECVNRGHRVIQDVRCAAEDKHALHKLLKHYSLIMQGE